MKLDVVLQGECSLFTLDIIQEYKKLDFVGNIILSSYHNHLIYHLNNDIKFVDNEIINPKGLGNRNLQINTSRNGIHKVSSEYTIKMRTDQFIRLHSMNMMYDYWLKNMRDGLLFVLGMYTAFPYHPRDHLFWGKTSDLIKLFDVPFDIDRGNIQNYDYNTRAETYIGQFYYARFDPSITDHINNPLLYTVDKAPLLNEALNKDFAIRNSVFAPFPRVSMAWPKHGLNEYHYHIGEKLTEYWADDK